MGVQKPVHLVHDLVLRAQALIYKALVHKALAEKAQPRLSVGGNMTAHNKGRSVGLLGIGALWVHTPLEGGTLRKQTCKKTRKEVAMRV